MQFPSYRDPTTADVIDAVRSARFWDGLRCSHCASSSVIRWGSFRGRQRYRCKTCRATFSDLTGTPLAYTKLVPRWVPYVRTMYDSATLRKSAALLNIHLSTAFRWRHAVLNSVWLNEAVLLRGVVEVTQLRTYYSEKGSRHTSARPRRLSARGHNSPAWPRSIIFACDRAGNMTAGVGDVPLHRSDAWEVLGHRLAPGALVLSPGKPSHPFNWAAIQAGARHVRVRHDAEDELYNLEVVKACRYRFESWVRCFRGVATKYLDRYLEWFRILDEVHAERFAARLLGHSCRPYYPHFPRTTTRGEQAPAPPAASPG